MGIAHNEIKLARFEPFIKARCRIGYLHIIGRITVTAGFFYTQTEEILL